MKVRGIILGLSVMLLTGCSTLTGDELRRIAYDLVDILFGWFLR